MPIVSGAPPKEPSKELVECYLSKWKKSDKYKLEEELLSQLFSKLPNNNDINEVLLKVCAVNGIDNTRIYDAYSVAEHIVSLKIDKKLKSEDLKLNLKLVEEIAVDPTGNRKKCYSFASKYCARHKPDIYPMYDSHVDDMLWHFREQAVKEKGIEKEANKRISDEDANFPLFKRYQLEKYSCFQKVIECFRCYYKSIDETTGELKKFLREDFSLRQIDIYLWLSGKDYSTEKLKKEAIQYLRKNPSNKENQENKFTIKKISEEIIGNYPKESCKTLEKDKNIITKEELIQKFSDQISKDIYKIEKSDSNIKREDDNGTIKLYYTK